jgi:hypothetical protein
MLSVGPLVNMRHLVQQRDASHIHIKGVFGVYPENEALRVIEENIDIGTATIYRCP